MTRFRRVLVLAALLFVALCVACVPLTTRTTSISPIQQKATHMVTYVTASGYNRGLCTATAIGPHVLMTANHCDENRDYTQIELDLSLRRYHILKFITDERDHDLYVLDGPAFTNIVPYKTRSAHVGEVVYLYGNGAGVYPSRRLDGAAVVFDDPSDVDAEQGVVKFTMPVIPGDSGSVVYAEDGNIVAITTYSWSEDHKSHMTVDFTPAFTTEQLDEAMSFVPAPRKKSQCQSETAWPITLFSSLK